jgi:uncharacterized protein
MRIVLTGATGQVGSKLGHHLISAGHTLSVLARDPDSARAKLTYACDIFKWDAEKAPPPPESLDKAEVVLHLAGENVAAERWTEERKKRLRDSRVETANRLREGLKDHQLKIFLTASGIGYYGDRGDEWLTEESKPGDDFLAKLCIEWEGAADSMPAERILKARFGAVLGAGAGFLGKVVPMFKRFGASRLGMGRQWLSWIHEDDLCRLITHQLSDPSASGPLNMVSPNPITNAEMTRILGRAIGAWPGPPAPKFALKMLYGDLAEGLTASQRVRSTKTWDFKFHYPSFESAISAIFSPR